MTGWNLPPGCTDRDIDNAFGSSARGVYKVTVTRTMVAEMIVEVEASSEEDARFDAVIKAKTVPLDLWEFDQDDCDTNDVEGPPERDPDDERDSRADYLYDRNR